MRKTGGAQVGNKDQKLSFEHGECVASIKYPYGEAEPF